jgi:hypothetical protein
LRERRLQCPKPRENPVEELENRLGAKNGAATSIWVELKWMLGFQAPVAPFYTTCA